MADKVLELGIVGCGGISHAHGHAARTVESMKFVSCCDVVESTAKEWAENYGCRSHYTDYVEMIKKEKLDAIVLATWPNQHREQIEKCLKAGMKKILCEKALCLTEQEAVEIHRMVKDAGAFLMEAFMYRHHPAVRRIEKILAEGDFGPVDSVRAHFSDFDSEESDPKDPNRNWRQSKECGGGIPYDFACYCVNACNHFSEGLPRRVFASGGIGRYDTINRVYALIEYDNGKNAIIESSKQAACSQELQIVCPKRRITLPVSWTIPGPVDVHEIGPVGWVHFNTATSSIYMTDPYREQMVNFVDVINGKAKPTMPLRDSVINTFTLAAMVTSVMEKRPVDINLPDFVKKA